MGFLQSLLWLVTATFPCGRVLGIPVRVHVLIAVLVPLMVLPYIAGSGLPLWLGLVLAAAYVGVLFGSVLFHELGHAWGCRLVGGETDHIVLTPIGGVHMGTGGLESPRAELIVVALGPAASALLAGVGWALVWGLGGWFATLGMAGAVAGIVAWMVLATNTSLLLFNLLFLVFPLDGARLVRAALSLRWNPGRVTYHLCRFGIGLAILLVILWLLGIDVPLLPGFGPLMFLVALLGIQACLAELERIKHMPVYFKSDTWGERTMYYDADLVRLARSRFWSDLGGLVTLRWVGGLFGRRGPARVRPARNPMLSARVLDISPLPKPDDVDAMSDLRALEELQRRAVEREDYKLAARVKARITALLR